MQRVEIICYSRVELYDIFIWGCSHLGGDRRPQVNGKSWVAGRQLTEVHSSRIIRRLLSSLRKLHDV